MTRLRVLLILLAIVAIVVIAGAVQGRGSPRTTPTPAVTVVAALTPPPGATAGRTPVIVPTPAIPLPTCPAQMVPQVDNLGRYGFCTPVGWGAYNENNSLPLTQILKPRPGGNPILLPTEFDRIQIAINLNVGAPSSPPADCQAAPNDTISGLPAHHCAATLDPNQNPYRGVRVEFWRIDLSANRAFYITAIVGADASPEDQALISTIVHLVRPPQS